MRITSGKITPNTSRHFHFFLATYAQRFEEVSHLTQLSSGTLITRHYKKKLSAITTTIFDNSCYAKIKLFLI
jgi:hypothetical protein